MEWLIVLAALAIGVCGVAWYQQEHLIFFPQPVAARAQLPARVKPLEVVAADDVRLRGWMARGTATPAPAVIYFGGNAEEVSWTVMDTHWPHEWAIVGVNYRGYGASEGVPGERELIADALVIYDEVVRHEGIDPHRIVVFGRSLGTAVATHVAAERPVAGAILVSPFDSLAAIGKLHYPWLPVSLLLRHRFNALVDAKRSQAPLLVIVGETDSIIPPERSRALFDTWAGPKAWQVVPGEEHNSLGASDRFWDSVVRFLAQR